MSQVSILAQAARLGFYLAQSAWIGALTATQQTVKGALAAIQSVISALQLRQLDVFNVRALLCS